MNQFEGQVAVHLPAHAAEDELDLDGVADDHPEEIILVPCVRQARAGQVGLVSHLREGGVQAETTHSRAVLGQWLEDNCPVEAGARVDWTPVLDTEAASDIKQLVCLPESPAWLLYTSTAH